MAGESPEEYFLSNGNREMEQRRADTSTLEVSFSELSSSTQGRFETVMLSAIRWSAERDSAPIFELRIWIRLRGGFQVSFEGFQHRDASLV